MAPFKLPVRVLAWHNDYPRLGQCPAGHVIDDVAVQCPVCGRFVLFLPAVYERTPRPWPLVYGMVILLTSVIVFAVFRATATVWPLYWFLLLGVVHLYAIIFTRGLALASAAWLLSAATVVLVAWAFMPTLLGVSGERGPLLQVAVRLVPVLAWLLTTAYMFLIGRSALPRIEVASGYFLATATLTLGFWGVWLFYLENDLVTAPIYMVALVVGPLMPVICILFLFTSRRDGSWETRRWLLTLGALGSVALAANLILVEPLEDLLAFVLGRFLPRLVGAAPLDGVSSGWLGGPAWRSPATSLMLLVALALVVVQAALDTARSRASIRPTDEPTSGRIIEGRAVVRDEVEPSSGVAPRARALEAVAATTQGEGSAARAVVTRVDGSANNPVDNPVDDAVGEAVFVAGYLGETMYRIVTNLLRTLRLAAQAVLPPVAFSLLGLFIALVLGKLADYLRHGPFVEAVPVWGMALSILLGAVLLCGIAFDFASPDGHRWRWWPRWARRRRRVASPSVTGAPPAREEPSRRQRILGVPIAVVAAGTLLTSLAYFLVSLASWALLPMLWPDAGRPAALLVGDPFAVNLLISTAVLAVLATLYAAGRKKSAIPESATQNKGAGRTTSVGQEMAVDREKGTGPGRTTRLPGPWFGIPAGVTLLVVAVAAFAVAASPVRETVALLAGPYVASAEPALLDRVPSVLADSCRVDSLLVTGQTASVECGDGDVTKVSYHAFDAADRARYWYGITLRARGVGTDAGSCGDRWPAEQAFTGPGFTGRVACLVDRRGAWVLWTAGATLGIALRPDGEAAALYSSWSAGTFWLRPQ